MDNYEFRIDSIYVFLCVFIAGNVVEIWLINPLVPGRSVYDFENTIQSCFTDWYILISGS